VNELQGQVSGSRKSLLPCPGVGTSNNVEEPMAGQPSGHQLPGLGVAAKTGVYP